MNSKECMFGIYSGQGCAKCYDCPYNVQLWQWKRLYPVCSTFSNIGTFCIHYHSKGFNTSVSIHPYFYNQIKNNKYHTDDSVLNGVLIILSFPDTWTKILAFDWYCWRFAVTVRCMSIYRCLEQVFFYPSGSNCKII